MRLPKPVQEKFPGTRPAELVCEPKPSSLLRSKARPWPDLLAVLSLRDPCRSPPPVRPELSGVTISVMSPLPVGAHDTVPFCSICPMACPLGHAPLTRSCTCSGFTSAAPMLPVAAGRGAPPVPPMGVKANVPHGPAFASTSLRAWPCSLPRPHARGGRPARRRCRIRSRWCRPDSARPTT